MNFDAQSYMAVLADIHDELVEETKAVATRFVDPMLEDLSEEQRRDHLEGLVKSGMRKMEMPALAGDDLEAIPDTLLRTYAALLIYLRAFDLGPNIVDA